MGIQSVVYDTLHECSVPDARTDAANHASCFKTPALGNCKAPEQCGMVVGPCDDMVHWPSESPFTTSCSRPPGAEPGQPIHPSPCGQELDARGCGANQPPLW